MFDKYFSRLNIFIYMHNILAAEIYVATKIY